MTFDQRPSLGRPVGLLLPLFALTAIAALGAGAVGRESGLTVSNGVVPPEKFSKLVIFSVTPDGVATGASSGSQGNHLWKWTLTGGFKTGAALANGAGWSDNPKAPTARLGAWNKAHGWSFRQPGKPLGGRTAFFAFATGISKDSSVVVGSYGSAYPGDLNSTASPVGKYETRRVGENAVNLSIRLFVWTKTGGFKDLFDLAAPIRSVEPQTDLSELSVALSPDGKTVAFLTDKLYVLRAKPSFALLK